MTEKRLREDLPPIAVDLPRSRSFPVWYQLPRLYSTDSSRILALASLGPVMCFVTKDATLHWFHKAPTGSYYVKFDGDLLRKPAEELEGTNAKEPASVYSLQHVSLQSISKPFRNQETDLHNIKTSGFFLLMALYKSPSGALLRVLLLDAQSKQLLTNPLEVTPEDLKQWSGATTGTTPLSLEDLWTRPVWFPGQTTGVNALLAIPASSTHHILLFSFATSLHWYRLCQWMPSPTQLLTLNAFILAVDSQGLMEIIDPLTLQSADLRQDSVKRRLHLSHTNRSQMDLLNIFKQKPTEVRLVEGCDENSFALIYRTSSSDEFQIAQYSAHSLKLLASLPFPSLTHLGPTLLDSSGQILYAIAQDETSMDWHVWMCQLIEQSLKILVSFPVPKQQEQQMPLMHLWSSSMAPSQQLRNIIQSIKQNTEYSNHHLSAQGPGGQIQFESLLLLTGPIVQSNATIFQLSSKEASAEENSADCSGDHLELMPVPSLPGSCPPPLQPMKESSDSPPPFITESTDPTRFGLSEGMTGVSQLRVSTTLGNFVLRLRPDLCPLATRNFLQLSHEGFFNGLRFHRIVKGFLIQSGCPNGDGTGGRSIFGSDGFVDEIPVVNSRVELPIKAFTLCMANRGRPNTNMSQFFITTVDTPGLQGKHTAFGRVTKGRGVVRQIERAPTNHQQEPTPPIYILTITEEKQE